MFLWVPHFLTLAFGSLNASMELRLDWSALMDSATRELALTCATAITLLAMYFQAPQPTPF